MLVAGRVHIINSELIILHELRGNTKKEYNTDINTRMKNEDYERFLIII